MYSVGLQVWPVLMCIVLVCRHSSQYLHVLCWFAGMVTGTDMCWSGQYLHVLIRPVLTCVGYASTDMLVRPVLTCVGRASTGLCWLGQY